MWGERLWLCWSLCRLQQWLGDVCDWFISSCLYHHLVSLPVIAREGGRLLLSWCGQVVRSLLTVLYTSHGWLVEHTAVVNLLEHSRPITSRLSWIFYWKQSRQGETVVEPTSLNTQSLLCQVIVHDCFLLIFTLIVDMSLSLAVTCLSVCCLNGL